MHQRCVKCMGTIAHCLMLCLENYRWFVTNPFVIWIPHVFNVNKHRETHGCVVSTAATDALVLKHQVISILNANLNIHCIGPVSYKSITLMLDNIRKSNYVLKKKKTSRLRVKTWTKWLFVVKPPVTLAASQLCKGAVMGFLSHGVTS